MQVHSVGLLVPVLALIVVACASPTPPPTAQPPALGPTQATAPSPAPPPAPAQAAATAAVRKPTSEPTPATVDFAYPAIVSSYWHFFVAQEKGMYADEAIDFRMTFVQAGPPAIAQGVIAGAYQMGSASADIGVAAIQNGADVVYVASDIRRPVFSIAAQPEIKSFSDIKNNKTVGAASIRGGTSTLLRVVFDQKGLKDGVDYSVIAAGSTGERVGALKNRSVDVALLGQPQDFMVQDDGYPILGLTSDFIPEFATGGLLVRRDWAKANEDVVVRVVRAFARSIDWLYDPKNKDEAVRILAKATKLEEKYARKTYDLYVEKVQAFVPRGEPTERLIDSTIKLLVDSGELQGTRVGGSAVVDRTYWLKAMESPKQR